MCFLKKIKNCVCWWVNSIYIKIQGTTKKWKWVVVLHKFSQFTLSRLPWHTKQNTAIIFHLYKTLHYNFITLRCWQFGIASMEFLLHPSKVRLWDRGVITHVVNDLMIGHPQRRALAIRRVVCLPTSKCWPSLPGTQLLPVYCEVKIK